MLTFILNQLIPSKTQAESNETLLPFLNQQENSRKKHFLKWLLSLFTPRKNLLKFTRKKYKKLRHLKRLLFLLEASLELNEQESGPTPISSDFLPHFYHFKKSYCLINGKRAILLQGNNKRLRNF